MTVLLIVIPIFVVLAALALFASHASARHRGRHRRPVA